MKPQKRALTAAAAGTAIGVAGLGFIAMPAGAGEAPELPPVGAEQLVQSALTADTPALQGTVEVDNQLGLPGLPGVPALDVDSARVFNDGNGHSRLALQQPGGGQQTIVHTEDAVWTYSSAGNTATKLNLPAGAAAEHGTTEDGMASDGQLTDPAAATAAMLETVRETSTVSVDGTATVADRPAYELVLTPKPTERTLLREVRVAIDEETRMPLRLSVLANGTAEPALRIGFSDIEFTEQPADRFRFSPPQGAEVVEQAPEPPTGEQKPDVRMVGDGWDTVLVGSVPKDMLSGAAGSGGGEEADMDFRSILDQVSEPVSGPFGSGRVVTTSVGAALITDDGRFAAGAVPRQVLVEALGAK